MLESYQINPSMSIVIEGLHWTSWLRGGYAERVKVTVTIISQSNLSLLSTLMIRLRAGLLLTKKFLHPMMIAGPLFLMWVPVLVMVVILTVKMKVHIALGLLENKCKHIAQLLHIGIAYWGVLQGYVVDVMLKWHRYACSGFSLIGFYLVTVLEEANVAIPPLQVVVIINNALLSQLKILLRHPWFS